MEWWGVLTFLEKALQVKMMSAESVFAQKRDFGNYVPHQSLGAQIFTGMSANTINTVCIQHKGYTCTLYLLN